jgi:phage host-nuclease inhibitor protein Gam
VTLNKSEDLGQFNYERRKDNRELVSKVHHIELKMANIVGEIKADIKVLENRISDMCASVDRLHRTFYGTFIAAFVTFIFTKFF